MRLSRLAAISSLSFLLCPFFSRSPPSLTTMSFAIPLRSFVREGSRSLAKPGFRLQLGTRSFFRQASHQPGLTASSSSTKAITCAGPAVLLAGLGLSSFYSQPLFLETTLPDGGNSTQPGTSAPFSSSSSDSGVPHHPDMPKSDVNVYNLGFGTVCGICSGIFIKKGAKFIAFLLGGGFILLQVGRVCTDCRRR